MKRSRLSVIPIAVVLAASACGGADETVVQTDPAAQQTAEIEQQTDTGRFLDSELPTEPGPLAEFEPYSDPASFSKDADIVFVGSVVGTEANTFELGPPADEEALGSVTTQFDGLMLRIDRVLAGDAKEGETLTISTPVVILREGEPRLLSSNINDLVVNALQRSSSVQYLVFATQRPGTDILQFTTDGGFVEIAADGTILEGAPGSLFDYSLDGDKPVTHGYTIEIVQSWIDGNPPEPELPPSERAEDGGN